MGIITRLLHRSEGLTANRFHAFLFDTGENIHLHYRDLRVEFSVDEFVEFHDLCLQYLPQLRAEIEGGYRDGVHPNTNQTSTWKQFWNRKPLEHGIRYHPTRISLEENSDGYHVHIRNYKLLLDKPSFLAFARAAQEALERGETDVSVPEALDLLEVNELPNRVEFLERTGDIDEAMATLEPAYFKKACQVLAAVGFRRTEVSEQVHTYRKGNGCIHLRSGKVRPQRAAGRGVIPLSDFLEGCGKDVPVAELNLIKLQMLDAFARLEAGGRLGAAEIRHDRLLYDTGKGKLVFPAKLNGEADDPKKAFADFNRHLYALGFKSLKPAKIPYPAAQQERLQKIFEEHVRRHIAAAPCVKAIYLFGGPSRGKPSGRYEVPYVHFDWVKLGSDFDLLIEIDENHAIPTGWEHKFFWKPAASGYYHLGDVDMRIVSPYVKEYDAVDFLHHVIEAYLFLPSKGDAATKDAFIERFKGECIYQRDDEGQGTQAALEAFVDDAWGLRPEDFVSLAPPSFNEVYRFRADGRDWVAKFMRRQDFTPAVTGHRGEHLEYEAAILDALRAQDSDAFLLPVPGKDGAVLQRLGERWCMVFPFFESPGANAPIGRRITHAALALAVLHGSPVLEEQVSSRKFLFETAVSYNQKHYESLLERFKTTPAIRTRLVEIGREAGLAARELLAADLPAVHCHGDVCPANFFFLEGHAVLFDFQMAYRGPRISDVAEGALEFALSGESLSPELIDLFVQEYGRLLPLTKAEYALLPRMLLIQVMFRLARLFRLSVNFGYKVNESRLKAFADFAAQTVPARI